jgi:two-component system chemotaxis response regulator CheV
MKKVDMRTNLAGKNRMELLLFYLKGRQRFGINVFKVREVYQNPLLTQMPGAHPAVKGVTHFRGTAIPVIDLNKAIGGGELNPEGDKTIITSEFNRSMQGLMVSQVDRIVNMDWEQIQAPPKGSSGKWGSYVIAITEVENELIEVLDVERILEEISPSLEAVSASTIVEFEKTPHDDVTVMIADDSAVARKKICQALKAININVVAAKTGKEAWDWLLETADEGTNVNDKYPMLITDIEMPEMDGYTLVANIRNDQRMDDLYIAMHSSMSGEFNESLVSKVGANEFLAKFHPDEFARMVKKRVEHLTNNN